MTVAQALRHATAALAAAGIDTPGLESRLLLAHAMGLDQSALLRDRSRPVPEHFAALLDRRLAHEPLALITGRQGFWTLDLEVSADTLIPRADSETLVDAALAACPAPGRVLDLGTGTGCLLLAVLSERPGAWGLGIDINPRAAALARRNAQAAGLSTRAAFAAGSWADAVGGSFDLVLSNPPYIETDAIAGLMPEVAEHEPRTALDGGADGLDAYRAIVTVLPRLLAPGGLAVLELGAGQAEAVAALSAGFQAETRRDLGGVERALLLTRPAQPSAASTARNPSR